MIGDVRAVEPLIAALRDPFESVCEHAAKALGEIGDARAISPLIAILHDFRPNVSKYAANALAKVGTPAVEPLLATLADPNTNKDVEFHAPSFVQIGRGYDEFSARRW